MSEQFKKDMDQIDIPTELHERVRLGVHQAKTENIKSHSQKPKRQLKPYMVTLLAAIVVAILILPTLQTLKSPNIEQPIVQGTVTEEPNETNLIDGDANVNMTEEMHQFISDYIILQSQNQYEQTDAQFEVHKVYGTLQEGDKITVYLWSFYNRFNRETGNEEVSGASQPISITLEKNGDEYKVIDFIQPEDGSQFVESIQKMFPNRYVEEVFQQPINIDELKEEMQQKVNAWLLDDAAEMEELANIWANALKTRDGKPRYEIMSESAKERFLLEQDSVNGDSSNFVIGVSSPWVVSYEIQIDGKTATITYQTQTSEGSYEEKEIIHFTIENGKLVVDDYKYL